MKSRAPVRLRAEELSQDGRSHYATPLPTKDVGGPDTLPAGEGCPVLLDTLPSVTSGILISGGSTPWTPFLRWEGSDFKSYPFPRRVLTMCVPLSPAEAFPAREEQRSTFSAAPGTHRSIPTVAREVSLRFTRNPLNPERV